MKMWTIRCQTFTTYLRRLIHNIFLVYFPNHILWVLYYWLYFWRLKFGLKTLFYNILSTAPFKVVPCAGDTPLPTFLPLLECFLERTFCDGTQFSYCIFLNLCMFKKIPNFSNSLPTSTASALQLLSTPSGRFWQQTAICPVSLWVLVVKLHPLNWAREFAYSLQHTIFIYRTQLIFRICSTCSIYSTPWLLHYPWVFWLVNLGCLIIWYFTGEVTEIYTVQSHLEKVVPRSGSCKLNMMTRC